MVGWIYLVKSLTVNYSHWRRRFTKEHVIVNYTWFLLLVLRKKTNERQDAILFQNTMDEMQRQNNGIRLCPWLTEGPSSSERNSYCSTPMQYRKKKTDWTCECENYIHDLISIINYNLYEDLFKITRSDDWNLVINAPFFACIPIEKRKLPYSVLHDLTLFFNRVFYFRWKIFERRKKALVKLL